MSKIQSLAELCYNHVSYKELTELLKITTALETDHEVWLFKQQQERAILNKDFEEKHDVLFKDRMHHTEVVIRNRIANVPLLKFKNGLHSDAFHFISYAIYPEKFQEKWKKFYQLKEFDPEHVIKCTFKYYGLDYDYLIKQDTCADLQQWASASILLPKYVYMRSQVNRGLLLILGQI